MCGNLCGEGDNVRFAHPDTCACLLQYEYQRSFPLRDPLPFMTFQGREVAAQIERVM